MDPVRPLRGINGVGWGPILSHCTSARYAIEVVGTGTVLGEETPRQRGLPKGALCGF